MWMRRLSSGLTGSRVSSVRRALRTAERAFATPGKVKVNVKTPDGTEVDFDATAGKTLMEALRDEAGLFVVDCCSGSGNCTACHVYVDPKWYEKLNPPSEHEQDMLDQTIGPKDNSRLSCQVRLTASLDGLAIEQPSRTVNLMINEKALGGVSSK